MKTKLQKLIDVKSIVTIIMAFVFAYLSVRGKISAEQFLMERMIKMNAPYKGTFRVSQIYKGAAHDGLDLVGISSKDVYATVSGTVSRAGWENPTNCKQGFGQYVRIDCKIGGTKHCAYYGHLSKIGVKVGDAVQAGDLIGTEGSTGHSTGSHVHYCERRDSA